MNTIPNDQLIGMTIRPIEEELLMIFKMGGASIKIPKGSSRSEVSGALQELARIIDPDNSPKVKIEVDLKRFDEKLSKAAAIANRMIVYSIINCARCGEDHESIWVKKFKLNPIDDFDFWGICPTTGEPIIVKVAEPDPEWMESEIEEAE